MGFEERKNKQESCEDQVGVNTRAEGSRGEEREEKERKGMEKMKDWGREEKCMREKERERKREHHACVRVGGMTEPTATTLPTAEAPS